MEKCSFMGEASLSDEQFQKMAVLLYKRYKQAEREKTYASVKHILTYLGIGATIATAFFSANAAGAIGKIAFSQSFSYDPEGWKRYNKGYLRQALRRLDGQKLVEHTVIDGQDVISITKRGKTKILKYALENLEVKKPKEWDGKWRVVIYDIPARDRSIQLVIRDALKALGLHQMQESVYIIPYPCYEEVEFLRSFYGVGSMVKYLLVTKLEDDTVYREYFGV